MTIFLVGGGTGGPTSPLLAVAERLRKIDKKIEFVFVGSKKGPEQKLLDAEGIKVKHVRIPAGKWRRYFSFMNFVDVFKIFFGFLKSLYLIIKYKPDLIFGAGSYVQVPVAWAAYFLKIPVVVHQQDLNVLLSTKLVAPIVKKITVSFYATIKKFPHTTGMFRSTKKTKIIWVGNPVRASILKGSVVRARKKFNLNDKYPTVLIMGGGSGSKAMNEVVLEAAPKLVEYVQVIHLTGGRLSKKKVFKHEHYHQFDFLGGDLKHAYAVSDLVISRGGMSTIGEIAALGKASVLIPLPDSPQMQNVQLLSLLKCAVAVSQDLFTPDNLLKVVRNILWSADLQKIMQDNVKKLQPKDADKKLAKVLIDEMKKHA